MLERTKETITPKDFIGDEVDSSENDNGIHIIVILDDDKVPTYEKNVSLDKELEFCG